MVAIDRTASSVHATDNLTSSNVGRLGRNDTLADMMEMLLWKRGADACSCEAQRNFEKRAEMHLWQKEQELVFRYCSSSKHGVEARNSGKFSRKPEL